MKVRFSIRNVGGRGDGRRLPASGRHAAGGFPRAAPGRVPYSRLLDLYAATHLLPHFFRRTPGHVDGKASEALHRRSPARGTRARGRRVFRCLRYGGGFGGIDLRERRGCAGRAAAGRHAALRAAGLGERERYAPRPWTHGCGLRVPVRAHMGRADGDGGGGGRRLRPGMDSTG